MLPIEPGVVLIVRLACQLPAPPIFGALTAADCCANKTPFTSRARTVTFPCNRPLAIPLTETGLVRSSTVPDCGRAIVMAGLPAGGAPGKRGTYNTCPANNKLASLKQFAAVSSGTVLLVRRAIPESVSPRTTV